MPKEKGKDREPRAEIKGRGNPGEWTQRLQFKTLRRREEELEEEESP